MFDLCKIEEEQLLKDQIRELKDKKSFWPSETDSMMFELWCKFKGIAPSNPMTSEKATDLGTRKLTEEDVVTRWDKAGILIKPEKGQHRVSMTRDTKHGTIDITGYMDAIVKTDKGNEVPVEIKTAVGMVNKKDLEDLKPKLSYLKQLAIYMDFMKSKFGILYVIQFSTEAGQNFIVDKKYQFVLKTEDFVNYTCMIHDGHGYKQGESFNLKDTYDRWGEFKYNYLEQDIEPAIDKKYKYDVNTIDWSTIPKYKIGNMRNNRAVLGDWEVAYSSWKDLIIQKSGQCLGYTDEELAIIKEKTKGYSTDSWKGK